MRAWSTGNRMALKWSVIIDNFNQMTDLGIESMTPSPPPEPIHTHFPRLRMNHVAHRPQWRRDVISPSRRMWPSFIKILWHKGKYMKLIFIAKVTCEVGRRWQQF